MLRAHQERLLGIGPGRAANKPSSCQEFLGPQSVGLAHEDVQVNKSSQRQFPLGINREGRALVGNCFNPRSCERLKNAAQFSSQ